MEALIKKLGKDWRHVGRINSAEYHRNRQIFDQSDVISSVSNILNSFVECKELPTLQVGYIPEKSRQINGEKMEDLDKEVFYEHWHKMQSEILRDMLMGGFVVYTLCKIRGGPFIPVIITRHIGIHYEVHVFTHMISCSDEYFVLPTKRTDNNGREMTMDVRKSRIVVDSRYRPAVEFNRLTSVMTKLAPKHEFMDIQMIENARATILNSNPTAFLSSSPHTVEENLDVFDRHEGEVGKLGTMLNFQVRQEQAKNQAVSFEQDFADTTHRLYDKLQDNASASLLNLQNHAEMNFKGPPPRLNQAYLYRPAIRSLEMLPMHWTIDGQIHSSYINNWREVNYVHNNDVARAFGVPDNLISGITTGSVGRTALSEDNMRTLTYTVNKWRGVIGEVMSHMFNLIYTNDDPKLPDFRVVYPEFKLSLPTPNMPGSQQGQNPGQNQGQNPGQNQGQTQMKGPGQTQEGLKEGGSSADGKNPKSESKTKRKRDADDKKEKEEEEEKEKMKDGEDEEEKVESKKKTEKGEEKNESKESKKKDEEEEEKEENKKKEDEKKKKKKDEGKKKK